MTAKELSNFSGNPFASERIDAVVVRDMDSIRYLLASDMDGTVIPLDDQPERADEITAFSRALSEKTDVALAYATGRDLQRALNGIAEWKLPTPNWLICDVGTSLYHPGENGKWNLSEEYRAEMRSRFGGHTANDVAEVLQGYPEQDASRQTEFKQSYFFNTADHPERHLPEIDRKLQEAGIQAELVYSVDVYSGEAFLDVLPSGVAKDYAVHFLQQQLGLDADHVVYAGDSGNDEHAFKSGINGIVVANADPKLITELNVWADESDHRDKLFFASRPFIAGVHEGCRHFGLLN